MSLIKSIDNLPQAPRHTHGEISYDFTPFSLAPAILEKGLPDGRLHVINIPQTTIPSPTASNISPGRLRELKDGLVGKTHSLDTTAGGYKGNGAEIWESWKRAWDLWNNHFIEGRVNPTWMKKAWSKRAAAWQKSFDINRHQIINREQEEAKGPPVNAVEWDGSSGGYCAIKDMAEYRIPRDDEELTEDFVDVLENSVWMPRRVGEKTLEVGLDVDYSEFLVSPRFERGGGIDCGRSPYPVLRPLIENIVTKDGGFIKRKVWDGVAGTVFNMPTRPREPEDVPDASYSLIQQRFRHQIDEEMRKYGDIFPLNIRRVKKVLPQSKVRTDTPLLEPGDILLEQRGSAEGNQFDNKSLIVDKSDPWWVADEQRRLRDHPSRFYPLDNTIYDPNYLVVDDTIWREEYQKDQSYDARYFVTNLHGGTLLINGMEVKKGDVAGPLPAFAIIESPGGQVSFWWGVEGRNYGQGEEPATALSWDSLRRDNGWEYTGMIAGEVWNLKFKDRWTREKEGKSLGDDVQWNCWKADTAYPLTKEVLNSDGIDPANHSQLNLNLPHSRNEFMDTVFENEDDELCYLLRLNREYRNERSARSIRTRLCTVPDYLVWPGSNSAPATPVDQVTNEEVISARSKIIATIDKRKKERNVKRIRHQEEYRAAIAKRKSSELHGSLLQAKRPRTDEPRVMKSGQNPIKRKAVEAEYVGQSKKAVLKQQRMEWAAYEAGRRAANPTYTDKDFESVDHHRLLSKERQRQNLNKIRRVRGLYEIPPIGAVAAVQPYQETCLQDTQKIAVSKPQENEVETQPRLSEVLAKLRKEPAREIQQESEAKDKAARKSESQRQRLAKGSKNLTRKEQFLMHDAEHARDKHAAAAEKRAEQARAEQARAEQARAEQAAAKDRQPGQSQPALNAQAIEARKRAEDIDRQIAWSVAHYPESSLEGTRLPSVLAEFKASKLKSPTINVSKVKPKKRPPPQTREEWHESRFRSGNFGTDRLNHHWRYYTSERSSKRQNLHQYLDWEYNIWQDLQPTMNEKPMSRELTQHRQLLLPELLIGLADRAWLDRDPGVDTESTIRRHIPINKDTQTSKLSY